jgi:hypothetical protein
MMSFVQGRFLIQTKITVLSDFLLSELAFVMSGKKRGEKALTLL